MKQSNARRTQILVGLLKRGARVYSTGFYSLVIWDDEPHPVTSWDGKYTLLKYDAIRVVHGRIRLPCQT